MFILILLGLVASSLAWLYIRWSRVRNYWSERGVPHLPPHPVLGNLTFVNRINTNRWFKDFYKKINAPYAGMWLLWRPALVVNDPEITRNILVKDFDIFRDRYLGSGDSDSVGHLNIFTVNEPAWSNNRRKMTSMFTASRMRDLYVMKNKKIAQLIDRINKNVKENKKVDVRSMFTDFTTDVITYAIFGVECDASSTGESPVRSITKEFMKYSLIRGLSWASIFFFPDFVNIFRLEMFPKASTEYLRRIFRELKSQRQQVGENTRYLLDILLKREKDALGEGEEISEDELLAQIAIVIQGGFDTTATAATFAISEIAYNQEIQDKLYRELLEAKEKVGSIDLDANTLSELPYLNCVLKETFRKYPPMGWLDRIAAADYKIDDKLTIKAKTPVFVNAIGLHYDPELFPEPEKFMPERFLPENEAKIPPFIYMPFGEGPRSCIGKRLGISNVRLIVTRMVLAYSIQRLPDTPRPQDIQWEKRAQFLIPADTISFQLTPRN